METCPYIEASFQILGRKWNGQLIHYLSVCQNHSSHFSEMKRDFHRITPRALSLKLSELADYGLIHKKVEGTSPVIISYQLTATGCSLAEALKPVQEWAQQNMKVDINKNEKETDQ